MGSGAKPSKNRKNISGEEKRKRKKNPKSRKRRRISSSKSSYSSDSDDISRDRRRRRSSRRMTEKRRGREPKRSVTRKSLKVRRRSASSSSWDSSSSCSTCRCRSSGDLDKRSRSPFWHKDDRKGKSKIKERGRKLNRDARSSRIRNRSPSCSTCSGSISPSSSQKRRYREEKSLERDGSSQIGLDRRMASGDEMEETYEIGGRETNNKMIIKNHNDLRLPQGIVDHNVEGVEEEEDGAMVRCSYEQAVDMDRWMGGGNVENYSPYAQFEYGAFIRGGDAQISDPYQEFGVNTEVSKRIKSKVVATDKHDSESDDLELMLRQKALENLKKLRCGLSSDSKTIGDSKNVSAGDQSSEQPCETSKKYVNPSESHFIISKQEQIQGGLPSHVSEVDPFNELSKEATDCTLGRKMMFGVLDQTVSKQLDNSKTSAQSTSNKQSSLQDSHDKMSSKQYPYRGSQEKTTTARRESGNGFMNEVSFGDGSGSMNTCANGEKKINDSNKTLDECHSGSQFEQKTFSRMHDGEMVQVSYKVYIPKKTPALARRKVQR